MTGAPKFGRPALLAILFLTPAIAQIQNQPDDGQWPMAAKNYASTRFSTLDRINTGNAKNLKLAWTFSTGLTRGHEIHRYAVSQPALRARPDQARCADEVGVRAERVARLARLGMLRRGESWHEQFHSLGEGSQGCRREDRHAGARRYRGRCQRH